MIGFSQDVFITALDADIGTSAKLVLGGAGGLMAGPPGLAAGLYAGRLIDMATTTGSLVYDTSRLSGATPMRLTIGYALPQGGYGPSYIILWP
jgi:hypothetical protein